VFIYWFTYFDHIRTCSIEIRRVGKVAPTFCFSRRTIIMLMMIMVMKGGCRFYSWRTSLPSLPIFIYLPSSILPLLLLFSLSPTSSSLLLPFLLNSFLIFVLPSTFLSSQFSESNTNDEKEKQFNFCLFSSFSSTSHYISSITFSCKVY
jgi:hypothetical protein